MSTNEKPKSTREYYIYDLATKQRIPVDKEVYDEFYRPIWNTFRRAHRHGCCSCPGIRWWLCPGDCAVCKYCTAGDNLSLDYEQEILCDTRSDNFDTASIVTDGIVFKQLLKRLDVLMPEARRVGELRLDGLSDKNIADVLGVPRTTLLYRIKKAEARLRSEYGDIF